MREILIFLTCAFPYWQTLPKLLNVLIERKAQIYHRGEPRAMTYQSDAVYYSTEKISARSDHQIIASIKSFHSLPSLNVIKNVCMKALAYQLILIFRTSPLVLSTRALTYFTMCCFPNLKLWAPSLTHLYQLSYLHQYLQLIFLIHLYNIFLGGLRWTKN